MSESLQEIITKLWVTPERAEWTPKADVVALSDIQRWMASGDIEILGSTHVLLGDRRFRIEPPISLSEYVEFTKPYCERRLRENPDGEWSDLWVSAGGDLVNIFACRWRTSLVPRPVLTDLKKWLGQLCKEGDPQIRTRIVQATLEHLFEQEEMRKSFSHWEKDEVLALAQEASEWYKGGGTSRLGKPPFVPE